VEIFEEAVGLVRRASAMDLCCYGLGTLPFVFYFLFFFGRRTGADGFGHLVPESLALSLLYLWMKYWQSVYAHRLLAAARNVRKEFISPTGPAMVQATLQPWSFLLLPVALLLTVPFGWCYAFFQNVTVLGSEGDVGTVFRRAYRQSLLFPAQNLLVILFALILSLIVFVNLFAAAFLIPLLTKQLLGIETVFSRSHHFLFNMSFLAFLAALTYLCVDPFVKAAYVLRCYYGECLETGADLLAELRALRHAAGKSAAVLLAVSFLMAPAAFPAEASTSAAGTTAHGPAARSAEARDLDRAINDVLKRPEFSWPSLQNSPRQNQRIPGFLEPILSSVKGWANQVGRWIERFFDWLAEHLLKKSRKEKPSVNGGNVGFWTVPVLMYGLLALLLCVCGVMLWRRIGNRRKDAVPTPVSGGVHEPDIRDEDVTPGELSGERWHRLAGELLVAGEARLAIRALYFASIAHLAEAGLLTMDKAKSDRDYERELRRRAHSRISLLEAFTTNVSLFQRVWYGMHAVDDAVVDTFRANYLRMASHEK
jgi:hypothetical protein